MYCCRQVNWLVQPTNFSPLRTFSTICTVGTFWIEDQTGAQPLSSIVWH
jgi:hypothetical protein